MRSELSSSGLIRLLSGWSLLGAASTGPDFAERLSLWLGAFDAIRLQGVIQSLRGACPAPVGASEAAIQWLADAYLKARSRLELGFAGVQDIQLHRLPGEAPTYPPFRQFYQDQQRQMEQGVAALRSQVRQRVAKEAVHLRPLVTLDVTLEPMLAPREQRLLARVPALMEKRFRHWRDRAEDPLWCDAFAKEMQDVLCAELNVRLLPVLGLIEALSPEGQESL